MSDWGIALIAAGSALGGSLITGWYTRIAGSRQAEAARHAGDRQADALLDTVRATLEEERAVRISDLRRQAYVKFLDAAETAIATRRTGTSTEEQRLGLQRAYAAVLLEGPFEVAQAARELINALHETIHPSLDDLERGKRDFVNAAQTVLNAPGAGFRA